jgi:hypothetical protein
VGPNLVKLVPKGFTWHKDHRLFSLFFVAPGRYPTGTHQISLLFLKLKKPTVGVSKNRMATKVSIPFLEVSEGFLCAIKVSINTRCNNKEV